jgi:predicted Zn-dependent protease
MMLAVFALLSLVFASPSSATNGSTDPHETRFQQGEPARQTSSRQDSSSLGSSARGSSFEHLSQAAERARSENRDEDAIGLYQQALALQPAWKEGLWFLSTLLYEKERFSEARNLLRRFVSEEPKAGPAWALLGLSEFQTREYARSLDHLQRAMALGMDDRKDMIQSVFYFVAVLLTRFEQYSESTNMMIAMVKSGGRTDLLVEPLGLSALRLPYLPSEIPTDRRELIRLAGTGALALESQQQAEAESLFAAMVNTYPKEPGVHFLYGTVLLDRQPEEGVREIKRELETSPYHVPARLRLAEEYAKEQQMDQALQYSQEAVRFEPENAHAHMILGEVLIAKSDLTGGIQELEAARSEAPETMRIHWDLLKAYTSAGRADDAKREKEEIENLNRPKANQ